MVTRATRPRLAHCTISLVEAFRSNLGKRGVRSLPLSLAALVESRDENKVNISAKM